MIRWTEGAQTDLVAIAEWIARHDTQAAESVIETILTRIDQLEQFPFLGPLGRVSGTRERVIGRLPYVVVYTAGKEIPIIVRILHGAMQWSSDDL